MSEFAGLISMQLTVRCALDAIRVAGGDMPRYGEPDYHERIDQWRRAQDQELERTMAALAKKGACFSSRLPHDHAVKILGIRASSTSGFAGALNNWCAAVSRRVEAALDEPLEPAASHPANGGKADRPSEPVRGPAGAAASKASGAPREAKP